VTSSAVSGPRSAARASVSPRRQGPLAAGAASRVQAWHDLLLDWYDQHARDLPWRENRTTPWGVLVSEIMLQQTPVARVLPVWETWLARWPTPLALAVEPAGEAVRAWGRLGYPRRALRLHEASQTVSHEYDGQLPANYAKLLALPGVGVYTASAVAAFAFGARLPVVDSNVARVLARAVLGQPHSPGAPYRLLSDVAAQALPDEEAGSSPETAPAGPAASAPDRPTSAAAPSRASAWSVALMELGALVCTSRSPACSRCPLAGQCSWQAAGHPGHDAVRARRQQWVGTDRQARGRLLGLVRDQPEPVSGVTLRAAWPVPVQQRRALAGLVADGLVVQVGPDSYALPS